MDIHPQSFRALAYEVQNHLYNSGATDDSRLTLPLIEQELREQYGILLKDLDSQRERRGEEPEAYRLTVLDRPMAGEGLTRWVTIPALLTFQGKAYVSFAGIPEQEGAGMLGFTPVDYRWQLAGMVDLEKKPAFCVETNGLVVRLTPETVLADQIQIIGVPADPFPQQGRADSWYWKQAWAVPNDIRGKVKMQALRVFMGTHIQLMARADTKNNGTEG